MKVFILGLDGLDYNLVKKWSLKNLQQEVFGKLTVPISKQTGVPLSPDVWASFLTGKQVVGLDFVRNGPAAPLLKILKYIRKHINLGFGIGRPLSRRAPARTFPKLNMSTFIDRSDVVEINAPFYSYDHTIFFLIEQFGNDEISLQHALNRLVEIYEKRKKQILQETEEKLRSANIVFAYMHFPDGFQHFLFPKPQSLKKYYIDLDIFVLGLKEILNDIPFIIVSDHGFDIANGTHSRYGFFSSSFDMNPKPKHITDFYLKIVRNSDY